MLFVYIRIGWHLGLYTLLLGGCLLWSASCLHQKEGHLQSELPEGIPVAAGAPFPDQVTRLDLGQPLWVSLGCTVTVSLAEEFWDDLRRLGARDAIEVSSVWITQEMSHLSSYILSSLTSRRLLRVSWRLLHIIPFFYFAFVPSCQILDQLPRRVFCFCIPGCLLSKCFATLYIFTKFINIYCQINWVDTSHGSQTCYFLIWGFWVRCQSWYNLETC